MRYFLEAFAIKRKENQTQDDFNKPLRKEVQDYNLNWLCKFLMIIVAKINCCMTASTAFLFFYFKLGFLVHEVKCPFLTTSKYKDLE